MTSSTSTSASAASGAGPGTTRRRVAGERSRRRPATAVAQRTDQPADQPEVVEASAPAGRPSGRRWLLPVLAVLAVVTSAAAAWLVAVDREQQAVADARTAAVAQAREHAETILSYSHERLDEDFAAALEASTGEFREEYERTSETAVRPLAQETRATVQAEVAAVGVVSATPDEVVVLAFVNQTTTSSRLEQPRTDLNRVRLTLVHEGGTWLVAGVDAL